MKRVISVLLVLATLLCLVPVSATAATEEPQANSEESTFSYLDLYVKDGLVALFDAYSATASSTAPTSWTPVDFYGKEGYEDYLKPVAYPLYDNAATLAWKWQNGSLSSYVTTANGSTSAQAIFFNLSDLCAQIGTTYSVQEVYQIASFNRPQVAPEYEVDAEGHYIITNYTDFSGIGNEAISGNTPTNAAYYGPLFIGILGYHKYSGSNDPVIAGFFSQVVYFNSSNTRGTGNVFFNTANYLSDATNRTWYYMKATTKTDETTGESITSYTKTSLGKARLWEMPTAVMEQTVSRKGAGVLDENTGYTAIPYQITWQFMPSKYGSSGATSRTKAYTTHVGGTIQESTKLRIFAGKAINAYSSRVYNTVLTSDEINQNHLADLCGYYGVEVSSLIALDAEKLVAVANAVADVKLSRDNDDAAAMVAAKQEFETRLYEAIAAAIGDVTYSYLDLYVKDGLVALFDAHGVTAKDAAPTTWTPVNFYGKKGYDSYLEPVAYNLTGTWSAKDGAYGTKTDASLRLASLVAAMGAALGTAYPDYTVQEVFGVTAAPTINAIYTKDEAGDWIIENYDALAKKGTANAYSTYGAIRMCYSFYSYCQKPSGDNYFINNYLFQMQYHNGKNYTYKRNAVLTNNYYGGEKAVYYYMVDGVKTALASGASIYAARFPSNVWEQTVTRSLDIEKTTAESIVFDNKVSWQFVPGALNSGSYTGRGFAYETANDVGLDYDVLTVFGGKNANVYSLRVYNKVITENEMDQNHLADLCGFFGVDASPLSFVMEDKLATLVAEYATVKMLTSKTDENGNYTDEYITVKNKLQLAINALAQEELTSIENAQNTLMSFDGYSFRISGDYGIRALFSLNKLSEERLSKKQVEVVAFGAITAIGEYDGKTYNTLENLVLTVADDGALSLPVSGAAFVASTDKNFKTLSESDAAVRFAYTATYPVDSNGAVFAIDMLYRGYAVLQDADGAYSVSYYDIPEEQVLSSLYDLHAEIVDDYGIYKDTLGTGAAFDRLYDVLTTVDPNKHDKDAREAARELADNYGFDEAAITHRFFTMSDVHCTTPHNSQKLTNILTRVNELYGGKVDAFLFAGDVADKINGGASDYDATAFATGYKQLALFAEYTAAGNINNVPIVWTLGNHERPTTATPGDVTITTNKNKVAYTIPANSSMLDAAYQIFGGTSSAFASATAGAPKGIRYNEIDGVSYFAVDYAYITADMLLWFDAELTRIENEKPGLPIIVTSHMPTYRDECPAAFVNLLSTHSNVLYLSGHVHTPMQNYSTVAERDGFQEIVVGPGNHASYGFSGGGYPYNSYEMRQGVVIEIDDRGNVRATMLDFAFNVEPDGSITELIHKGTTSGNTDNTAAENPLVLRQVLYTRPSRKHALKRVYDTVVYSKDLPEYEAPKFGADAKLSVSDTTEASLVLGIDKATATNLIKRYKITLTDSEGNAVRIYDPLAKKNVTALEIGSDYIVYGLYDNYPDTYVYKLYGGRTTTTVTVTEDDPATEDVDETVTETVTTYDLIVGESYTVTVVAYDDFGMETNAISTTFTIPNP